MADCPVDIILIDAFENAVKFGNALFRLDDFKLALPGLFFRFVSRLRPGGRSFGVQPGLSPCDLERDFPLLRGWDSQPDELFEVLLSDYSSYELIQRTEGRREVTAEDERQAEILCQGFRERWEEEEK